ncbi:hypothetical protein NIES25_57710 (plasmid) [Nostoc linckia NIES-25]|nr:hypothetical protein NIES25_57710 [Nostoc linckia NIES-25]
MKERIIQPKKITTDSFSIPTLRQPTRGFGLQSSDTSSHPVPDNPLAHDISRIPLRRPQTKLTVNQPGDIYEQQADTVAQQVVGRLEQLGNGVSIQRQQMPQESELQVKPLANSITPLMQRQEIPEEKEELQMKSLNNSTLQRESAPEEEEEEEELQMKSLDNTTLQRESAPEEEEEEEELQMSSMVQRQTKAGMAASPNLEASINQAKGKGQPMADDIRFQMEQAFGADFSGVKVHTDSQSDELNQSIQARAFTTGEDVFFRQGEYNPGSRGGQELLAHELTHVVQQNGAIQPKLSPEIACVQQALNSTSNFVQMAPIGGAPHNYTARNSSATFIADHLATDRASAEEATLNRANNGRGTTNTVLIETDANIKQLVLAADYDQAEHINGPVWAVAIACRYITVNAAHGANGNIIRSSSEEQIGTVKIKVYFDEAGRQISITGVQGTG